MKRKFDPAIFTFACVLGILAGYGFTPLLLTMLFIGWYGVGIDVSHLSFINLWIVCGISIFFFILYFTHRLWLTPAKKGEP